MHHQHVACKARGPEREVKWSPHLRPVRTNPVQFRPGRRLTSTQFLRNLQPIRILIHDNNQSRTVQLRIHRRRQPDGPGPNDHHRLPRRDLTIQHPTLQPRRHDVTQHHQRLLIHPLRHMMQPTIRQRDPHILRLRPINRMP